MAGHEKLLFGYEDCRYAMTDAQKYNTMCWPDQFTVEKPPAADSSPLWLSDYGYANVQYVVLGQLKAIKYQSARAGTHPEDMDWREGGRAYDQKPDPPFKPPDFFPRIKENGGTRTHPFWLGSGQIYYLHILFTHIIYTYYL